MNADVNRYLTMGKVPDNKHTEKEKVTLRRLASHTTGKPFPALMQSSCSGRPG